MALNFMIHCGGKEVEFDALNEVEVPAATRSYQPVPHSHFANIIRDALGEYGFQFGEQAHALNREGAQYFGMAELIGGSLAGYQQGWNLVAGWRTSYDKSLAGSFVVGSQVFVCDNLAFSGEVQFSRKHTSQILRDLPTLVRGAVGQTKAMAEQQEVRYERYMEAQLKDSVANHTIIRMLQMGVITSSKVEKVVNEYYEPSHAEHLNHAGQRTNWTLFNAATEALKGVGLNTMPKRTIALHGLMDQATDYALAA